MDSKVEYRIVIKREGRIPHRGHPTRDQWRVHEKRRFLLNEADLHYRCEHDRGVYECLAEVEWVKIEKRTVSKWVPENDPEDPTMYVGTDVPAST